MFSGQIGHNAIIANFIKLCNIGDSYKVSLLWWRTVKDVRTLLGKESRYIYIPKLLKYLPISCPPATTN